MIYCLLNAANDLVDDQVLEQAANYSHLVLMVQIIRILSHAKTHNEMSK
jgi:hypothetical protein